MPSNAMKLSQLIPHLQAVADQHGNLDCVLAVPAATMCVAIDGRNIAVDMNLPWQRLPQPAVIFGMVSALGGQLTNVPGQVYAADISAESEWNYGLDAAPEDTPLKLWKRHGALDDGYKSGGKFFVYEGGTRAWEIASGGVLAWKLP